MPKILNRKIIINHFQNQIFEAKTKLQKEFLKVFELLKITIGKVLFNFKNCSTTHSVLGGHFGVKGLSCGPWMLLPYHEVSKPIGAVMGRLHTNVLGQMVHEWEPTIVDFKFPKSWAGLPKMQ